MAWPETGGLAVVACCGRKNAVNNLKVGGEAVVWSALVRTLPGYVPLELTIPRYTVLYRVLSHYLLLYLTAFYCILLGVL